MWGEIPPLPRVTRSQDGQTDRAHADFLQKCPKWGGLHSVVFQFTLNIVTPPGKHSPAAAAGSAREEGAAPGFLLRD